MISFFSCNRKSIYYTNKELKEQLESIDSTISYLTRDQDFIVIDSGDYSSGFNAYVWESKLDTSDVLIKYVFNWEEGEIETLSCKAVYPTSKYGIWLGATGENSKLFKVKDGIWIPLEWPKDIVELYIRPKK